MYVEPRGLYKQPIYVILDPTLLSSPLSRHRLASPRAGVSIFLLKPLTFMTAVRFVADVVLSAIEA